MAEPKIPEMIPLGDFVRERRKAKGLLQSQVAADQDFGIQFIGRLERGERDSGILKVSKVCDALDIRPEECLWHIELGKEMVDKGLDPAGWREFAKRRRRP